MRKLDRFLLVLLWTGVTLFMLLPTEGRSTAQTKSASSPEKIVCPKIWDAKQLATWATPVAGANATPNFYTEEEYYAAPVDNLRTYPVYHPDFEPKGYREGLKKQGPQPMIEPGKLNTERDWIEAGRRVFEGLDIPVTRTDDPRMFKFLADRDAIKKDWPLITRDGVMVGMRWF